MLQLYNMYNKYRYGILTLHAYMNIQSFMHNTWNFFFQDSDYVSFGGVNRKALVGDDFFFNLSGR